MLALPTPEFRQHCEEVVEVTVRLVGEHLPSPEAHKAFGRRFGELHTHPAAPGPEGHPEILLLQDAGKTKTSRRCGIRT